MNKAAFNFRMKRYQEHKRLVESLERALLAANRRIKELETICNVPG